MKALFRKLGAFLTAIRVWSINILTLLVLVYVVGLVWMVVGKLQGSVDPQGKVLILAPEGLILDQEVYPSELSFPTGMPEETQVQTRDLVRTIRAAAADERLQGVVIDFSKAQFAGATTALIVSGELAALRESGKPVIAFSDSLSTASYLMAAQASEIYVHPSGAVAISGIGGYRDYTREMTEKLKVTIHNYSQGDYKSAVEGLTRNDMSEPDRRQRRELYEPIWDSYKSEMARARGVDAALIQALADNQPVLLGPEAAYDNLALAEEYGLIDGTRSFPDFRAYMIEKFGKAEDEERDTYPHITSDAYFAQLEDAGPETEDAVAVVFVQGAIQRGTQGPGVAGSDDIAGLLREAHEKDSTRAIVMRVNSPGGSIIASDMIRDELLAASAKDIPVVVSMGDVAASGGVWVSTPADRIYAEPMTITGSIGVAVAFPTLENVFDYIGVHFDGVTTSEYAGWGLNMAVDEKMDAIFARWAGTAYQRFIDLVADSRERDANYIRSIAGGRVWLAGAALERGLIDELGTMEDAIASAAEMAELDAYDVDYVVKEPSPGIALLRRFGASLGGGVDSRYGTFAQRMASLMDIVDGISQPRATVMCTVCVIEVQ